MSLPRGQAALGEERGLTLAEILVALAVIGIGLVGLTAVLPVSASGVQEGAQHSTAPFLAEQMIERARAAAWSAEPPVDCLGVSIGDAAPRPAGATCHGAAASGFPDETQSHAVSPTHAAVSPQDHLEPVLLDQYRSLGGHACFSTELVVRASRKGGK